jgi:hypothetical protein
MRRPGLWRARMAEGTIVMAVAAVLAASAPAGAASAEESRLLALTNRLRASVGAPALSVDESLTTVARAWATKMAADGTISHNGSLTTQVTGWSKVSENVGMGPDVDTVHRALIASPSHYANLVDTEVRLVGIGVAAAGRQVFVVENFLRPSGAAAVAEPAAPATTRLPAATPPKPAPPATPPPTTRPPAVPATAPPPVVAPVVVPSPWLALALEVTRGWERTAG